MDYLVYGYLQSGRDEDALRVVQQAGRIKNLEPGPFKSGYAATAMPIRYAVERHQWSDAEKIANPPDSAAQVIAISVWARGLGFARNGHVQEAEKEAETLGKIEERLCTSGNA